MKIPASFLLQQNVKKKPKQLYKADNHILLNPLSENISIFPCVYSGTVATELYSIIWIHTMIGILTGPLPVTTQI